MPYKSESAAAVLKRLNSQYYLPAIQRQFIWSQEQIISLFDSLMRGYPIGSFLFWQLDKKNRDKWESYKFVEDATQGGTRNPVAHVDGVNDLTLILDGQQRLTSILLGLKGTYTTKKKYMRNSDPTAWVKQRLYLDLLRDPKVESDDGEAGIHFGFSFLDGPPANPQGAYWFKVGRILDYDSEDRFFDFLNEEKEKLPDSTTKAQTSVFEKNLLRLFRAIWKDDVISYYTEFDQDYDRVLDIFVRANEGGVKLKKSELLLSMITSKWTGMNAKEEIFDFVDRLNSELTLKNDFDQDFVMKSCLVLSDLPVAYRVQNFSIQNLSTIQNRWEDIKKAIEKAVELINGFGIDASTLVSANALIPVAYYFIQHPEATLQRETPFDTRNAAAIRCWITMALLNGVFSGASDSILSKVREVLRNSASPEFPFSNLNAETAKLGRRSYFNQDALNAYLDISFGDRLSFLALSLLYDDNKWGTVKYHRDHIFPRSMFTWNAMREAGFSREQYVNFYSRKDTIANLELLLSYENQEKQDMPFERWIRTRDRDFLKRHLIPQDPDLWKLENFEAFLAEREKLIGKRLERLFGRFGAAED